MRNFLRIAVLFLSVKAEPIEPKGVFYFKSEFKISKFGKFKLINLINLKPHLLKSNLAYKRQRNEILSNLWMLSKNVKKENCQKYKLCLPHDQLN